MSSPMVLGLLLGSQTKRVKDGVRAMLAQGVIDIVIGTHALIQEGVEIDDLALVVVDEQHRFGVLQRASIGDKGQRPHVLAMSATPIPRSLALTVYGDLDISAIDQLPPGRLAVRTRWVESTRREAAYEFVRKQVEEGRQAFIVCPLVEESEVVQSRAAVKEHDRLSEQVFPELRVGPPPRTYEPQGKRVGDGGVPGQRPGHPGRDSRGGGGDRHPQRLRDVDRRG